MGNCFGSVRSSPIPASSGTSGPVSDNLKSNSGSTTTNTTNSESKFSAACSSNGQYSTSSQSTEEIEPNGRILEAPNLRIFTFAELRSATKNFKPDSFLGEGGFGRVYKGWVDEKTLNPTKSGCGMVVAVKKLNSDSMQGLEEWQSEINFLGRLSHPNLVRLLGYCWEDRELLLVYEFMSKGSLENHLFRKGVYQPLSWSLRLQILIDAARGLTFLHSSEKQVIYRDFKASNILLDSNFNAKISDFGLAKNGPAGENRIDVYGFGVVLLEMMTGQRALDTNRPSGQHNLVDWARPFLSDRRKLVRIMDSRMEGQYPSKAAYQAAQLSLRCLAGDPKKRPSMQEVAEELEKIATLRGKTKDVNAPPAAERHHNVRPTATPQRHHNQHHHQHQHHQRRPSPIHPHQVAY
ncbi:unnamed protein product [Spirodela intermedia]|uniref:non-specific serine/threonine protein kinase n=1 Tax=Spirodela intermedia TaxID=51605 RepID=A0A7I8J8W5_SPIIN|nr:unnamed protein product [Spirodela intermedia]CAA6666656.1 unnamed protein product [Spirodela intermedia]